jgi:hypothetical protein
MESTRAHPPPGLVLPKQVGHITGKAEPGYQYNTEEARLLQNGGTKKHLGGWFFFFLCV